MMENGSVAPFTGVVELDETYVGGRPRRRNSEQSLPRYLRPFRARGRGTKNRASS